MSAGVILQGGMEIGVVYFLMFLGVLFLITIVAVVFFGLGRVIWTRSANSDESGE